mmetsp:Transcript_25493/g.54056  ORF Transcript_25493/g.54056 Transcript_25493/m.54056 type:complete len:168 (-) Transcript_25493:54-557(-)
MADCHFPKPLPPLSGPLESALQMPWRRQPQVWPQSRHYRRVGGCLRAAAVAAAVGQLGGAASHRSARQQFPRRFPSLDSSEMANMAPKCTAPTPSIGPVGFPKESIGRKAKEEVEEEVQQTEEAMEVLDPLWLGAHLLPPRPRPRFGAAPPDPSHVVMVVVRLGASL